MNLHKKLIEFIGAVMIGTSLMTAGTLVSNTYTSFIINGFKLIDATHASIALAMVLSLGVVGYWLCFIKYENIRNNQNI